MTTLKVGDRVRVYGSVSIKKTPHLLNGSSGAVLESFDSGWVTVILDHTSEDVYVHSKQCRKLKPRPPARQFWIKLDTPSAWIKRDAPPATHAHMAYTTETPGCIHVREIRGSRK